MTQSNHILALVQTLLDDIEQTEALINEARVAFPSNVGFQMKLEMLEHRMEGNRDAVDKIAKSVLSTT